jgi:hypothetical protein
MYEEHKAAGLQEDIRRDPSRLEIRARGEKYAILAANIISKRYTKIPLRAKFSVRGLARAGELAQRRGEVRLIAADEASNPVGSLSQQAGVTVMTVSFL